MFKSLFGNNTDADLFKVADIAFEGKQYIESMFESLTIDGQAELYLFNIVCGSRYLKKHSIVSLDGKNADRFIAIGAMNAAKIKPSIDVTNYFELLRDRLKNYQNEYKLVIETQFSNNEYFPIYFYRRLYHHPLKLKELPEIEEWDDEYYTGDQLLDIYKHQINEIQNNLVKAFGKK